MSNSYDYDMDITKMDYSIIFSEILQPFVNLFYSIFFFVLTVILAMLFYSLLKYRINPFRLNIDALKRKRIRFKPFSFFRWLYIDKYNQLQKGRDFDQYGFTLYTGLQGSGKTTSMIEYLERMRVLFPKALIVTNFKYKYATHIMNDWRDFFEIRNGIDGVIFAIDEIHSEFSTAKSKDFPESLLSEISQQRKQRIKIVATSQVYTRVAKQIREQCISVVQCVTYANRWTFTREYEASEYDQFTNIVQMKSKIQPIKRHSFVQSDLLRSLFDTYEKIERLKGQEFLDRLEH